MTTIAFDLATKTGWYDGEKGGVFSVKRGYGEEWDFFTKVQDIVIRNPRTTAIAYEDACFQRGNNAYLFDYKKAVLHIWARSLNIPIFPYHVMTIKKEFTGDGRADKEAVIKEAKKYVKVVLNSDHADAIAVWHTHKKLYSKK